MESRRKLVPALASILSLTLVAGLAVLGGCGSSTPKLAYDAQADVPTVVYFSTKAIAPIYNASAPAAIVYGDGTLVLKEDSYKFTQGKLTNGVPAVLTSLETDGFFGLNKEYTGSGVAGGTTDTITVYLIETTKKVTAEQTMAPPGWSKIVDDILKAPTGSTSEYVPQTVILYSDEYTESTEGKTVTPWPADAGDLSKATATSGTQKSGEKLTGSQAKSAWLAIQKSFDSAQGEAIWSYNGKNYTYVYASPEFPGVTNE